MTAKEARAAVGQLVVLNGKDLRTDTFKTIHARKAKLMIASVRPNGMAVLEVPGRGEAGFLVANPLQIDLVPKYNLNRSGR